MAFDRDNFAKISSGYAHIVSPQMWSYLSLVDTIAEFFSPGYFDEVNEESILVNVGELFLMQDPITATIGIVESINPIVIGAAITAEALADNAVTTPKIKDGAVTLPKLAPGLIPFSHFIGEFHVQTVGGSAIEDFSLPGMTDQSDHFGFATMKVQGATTPTILGSFGISNAVRVEFSVNPGNDTFLIVHGTRLST